MGRKTLALISALFMTSTAFAGGIEKNIRYGNDNRQTYDAYLPDAKNAPVLVVVHGGAWKFGDKENNNVAKEKSKHFNAKGIAVISVNYRMLPDAKPENQAKDVASAILDIKRKSSDLGIDPKRIIVSGHSAGAHLVSLIGEDPDASGIGHIDGTIVLDSAALDLTSLMSAPHLSLYDEAFSADNIDVNDPLKHISAKAAPFLLVCSTRRAVSCEHTSRFAKKAKSLGVTAYRIGVPKSHGAIMKDFGIDTEYTADIEQFMGMTHPVWKAKLNSR